MGEQKRLQEERGGLRGAVKAMESKIVKLEVGRAGAVAAVAGDKVAAASHGWVGRKMLPGAPNA